MFYTGGQLDISGSERVAFTGEGAAVVGVSIPTPIVHPLVGFKVSGGASHLEFDGPAVPTMSLGAQLVMIFRYGSGPGFRMSMEPAARLLFEDPDDPSHHFELAFTWGLAL